MYCMEIRLRGGGLVSIRDGAYSRFDRSNVVEEFTPTQGLKGFLSKYVDETAVYRRQSQSEDDNPPSPITMEDSHGGSSPFYKYVPFPVPKMCFFSLSLSLLNCFLYGIKLNLNVFSFRHCLVVQT